MRAQIGVKLSLHVARTYAGLIYVFIFIDEWSLLLLLLNLFLLLSLRLEVVYGWVFEFKTFKW